MKYLIFIPLTSACLIASLVFYGFGFATTYVPLHGNHGKTTPSWPTCSNLFCLQQHEGKKIQVFGAFHPAEKQPPYLILSDEEILYLDSHNKKGLELPKTLPHEIATPYVLMRGKVFIQNIPREYGTMPRFSGPYLVDVESFKVVIPGK